MVHLLWIVKRCHILHFTDGWMDGWIDTMIHIMWTAWHSTSYSNLLHKFTNQEPQLSTPNPQPILCSQPGIFCSDGFYAVWGNGSVSVLLGTHVPMLSPVLRIPFLDCLKTWLSSWWWKNFPISGHTPYVNFLNPWGICLTLFDQYRGPANLRKYYTKFP